LLETRDLHVQEAAITGESMPAEKMACSQDALSTTDPLTSVFLGTSVVSGTGTARVIATGRSTSFGGIAARLADRPPETEFERGTRRFGLMILRMVIFLTLLIFLSNLLLKRDPLQSLLFSIALAVGLTPEFLPMIVAVTLSRGAVHMARRHVIVKHLQAIQNLGSMNLLCSDKTGTLTSGEMQVERVVDSRGIASERVRRLAYLNSVFETGIKSPLDAAILNTPRPDIGDYHKVDEIPFDFERRRVSIVVADQREELLIVKGAPESVLACCDQYESDQQLLPLTEEVHARCKASYEGACAEGLRVLAIAFRRLEKGSGFSIADECELTLAGFAMFADPTLPDAARALQALRRDGVNVKLLTGDNELVAKHVCERVGIDTTALVRGDEMETMTETALEQIAESTSVFARVSPIQKHRIILALKRRGHVVGFLGDGINDAPSLRAADVGISVATAVDIAKDAAEIILLRRGLATLHAGILEGRRAFANVLKYLLMGTSSNFGNMLSMAVAAFFLPFLPMLPTQILLNNLLYDASQLPIPTDRVDVALVTRPRRWDIGLIRNFMLCVGPISSAFDFLTFWVLIYVFHASESLFQSGWFVESLVTQTLVIFVVRTAGYPWRSAPSAALVAGVLGAAAVGVLLPYTPWADRLGFVAVPGGYLLYVSVATACYLALVQFVKGRLIARFMTDRPQDRMVGARVAADPA
jgi:Mg2+-importing ATPase